MAVDQMDLTHGDKIMRKPALLAALPALALAACSSPQAAPPENGAAEAETNALENAGISEPGPANASEEPGAEPVPPPDAVSHPDGYLPNAVDVPPPSGPGPGSSDPPATEDEYMRNRQTGG
jgi:hypothetical protein